MFSDLPGNEKTKAKIHVEPAPGRAFTWPPCNSEASTQYFTLSAWKIHSTSDQQSPPTWIFPEQNSSPCNSRFLAFSCISQNSVKRRLAPGSSNYRRRLPTPTSPRRGRRHGRFHTLSSLRHREAGCHCSSVFGRDKKCSTKSTLLLSRV